MVKIYNKLVRDKIPEIIENDGEKPITRILDDEEYKKELKNKLLEESQEAVLAENSHELMKEIGDIFEVIEAIEKAFGLSKDEILKMKEERKQKRGGFEKKIFLEQAE
ncbi:nucleoside triphosphate pyrophosphohydrolase [Patescibacteria group bacterium]|nr:nucleoside triphosphate pyrophosphohydrolase [Patescibacteria group bacterium]MBU4353236.1 nucleoside triphosphate pyrophosphohydrolase [Patescibacteria group bacterium]MBU4477132.1 nucleoside triphosphate pyrophosphohydrolase [Patescibacteria group bacterium]MCG2698939.1 nucleoside triphosphate pyrophosphohydrolase [Candidatus Parcubacteria bacterium]